MTNVRLGTSFPRELPPGLVVEFATQLEAGGADELWVVEDCFYTSGIALAATALARTERLAVGLGILPGVGRNAAITAMEVATLGGLAPGRLLAGIGHGVPSWMEQIGARPESPVTALEEIITAVRRLLAGEEVTVDGRYVHLDHVVLDQPSDPPPPVLAGVRGPRSLAMAGRAADGIVLAELTGPDAVRSAIGQAAAPGAFDTVVYTVARVDPDRRAARRAIAPWIAEAVADPPVALRQAPFFDEMASRVAAGGADVVVDLPDDWWRDLGAVGDPDDAAANIESLAAAGAASVVLILPPEQEQAGDQLRRVVTDVLPRFR